MKKYTHAWLSFKAVELLENKMDELDDDVKLFLKRFLRFITRFPATFVRGSWFPDTVIRDNILSGHTWKYEFNESEGRSYEDRSPDFNLCKNHVTNDFDKRIKLIASRSDLADRCEALSQTIRDMIKITNTVSSGDVIIFNDSQVATFFLMLSHYVADAHMPLHCDIRDFNKPSKIHMDMEAIWEYEINKFFQINKKKEQYDLDENGKIQRKGKPGYEDSFLFQAQKLTETINWKSCRNKNWNRYLGDKNNNIWDYLVCVCRVSFFMSHKIFPRTTSFDYDAVRIKKVPELYEEVIKYSPDILADTINSIAIVWLTTWMRWELLKKGIK